MTNLPRWTRPSMLTLRRDVEDILQEFEVPRRVRRELDSLLREDLSEESMLHEMQRLLDDFVSPPSLRRRVLRLLDRVIPGRGGGEMRDRDVFMPQVELTEGDSDYLMRVDLPGLRERDIDVRVDDDNVVTISGERRAEETKRRRGYQMTERTYGAFSRSVQLPRGADATKIEADFRNGVLELRAPKLEAARTRQIPIGGREGVAGAPKVIEPSNGVRAS